jgi:hypothetical protein
MLTTSIAVLLISFCKNNVNSNYRLHPALNHTPFLDRFQQIFAITQLNRRVSLFDSFVYLPLLHMLVEERAGERRFDLACPSPFPSPRSAGRGDVILRRQKNLPESEMRPHQTPSEKAANQKAPC